MVLMSKGFMLIGWSLHNDLAGNLHVHRAEARKCPRLCESERRLLFGVEHLGLEGTLGTDDGMGNIVVVGPSHGGSYWYGQRCRAKAEIIDFHSRSGRGRLLSIR